MKWEAGELEHPKYCAACKGENLVARHVGLDDLLGKLPGTWAFLACAQCDALHLDPRPTVAAVGKAYPDSYVTHSDSEMAHARDNGSGLLWRMANGYLNSRFSSRRNPVNRLGRWLIPLAWPLRQQLDYFYRHLPRRAGRLLDIGCGNGAFLLRARDAGWDVEGIEPDARAAAATRNAGLIVHATTIDSFKPEGVFDRITLSHVFEHVHDPIATLEHCHAWLRPGGQLWMSLPNPHGIGARIFGRSWFALDPPRHLFLPTPATVLHLMRAAGFPDARLLRRGRGSRSSIAPSVAYARLRHEPARHWNARILALIVDVTGSLFPRAAEEIVVVGTRTDLDASR